MEFSMSDIHLIHVYVKNLLESYEYHTKYSYLGDIRWYAAWYRMFCLHSHIDFDLYIGKRYRVSYLSILCYLDMVQPYFHSPSSRIPEHAGYETVLSFSLILI
mgnify:FL=1